MSSLLKAAKRLGELDEVPVLPPIKKPKRKLRSIPAMDEIEKTVRFATGWLKIAVALAVFAGLRSGELRALLVKHVDFGRAVLHITQAYSGSELKLPKTGTDREVPIDPRLHRLLTEAVKGKRPNEFLVVRAKGQPPRRREVAGHEDLKTTAQYLHGNIEQARQAMARLAEADRGSIVDPSLVLNRVQAQNGSNSFGLSGKGDWDPQLALARQPGEQSCCSRFDGFPYFVSVDGRGDAPLRPRLLLLREGG